MSHLEFSLGHDNFHLAPGYFKFLKFTWLVNPYASKTFQYEFHAFLFDFFSYARVIYNLSYAPV